MFGMLKGNKNGFRGCEEGRRNILALGNLLSNRDPPRISVVVSAFGKISFVFVQKRSCLAPQCFYVN